MRGAIGVRHTAQGIAAQILEHLSEDDDLKKSSRQTIEKPAKCSLFPQIAHLSKKLSNQATEF